MQNKKKCKYCQEYFLTEDKRRTYCSDKCSRLGRQAFQHKDIIGHLTLVSSEIEVTNKNRRTIWLCECICGTKIKRRQDYLKKEKDANKMLSCGCTYKVTSGKENPQWKGIGDLSSQYYSSVKSRAKNKGIEFNVSKKYLWNLFLEQNKKCTLSGLDLKLSISRKYDVEQTASLDRIDNEKGYVAGNVQWVHKTINFMKRNLSESLFIEMCKKVYENSL